MEKFSEPIMSPTMAGGLFAISAQFFKHIGTANLPHVKLPNPGFWSDHIREKKSYVKKRSDPDLNQHFEKGGSGLNIQNHILMPIPPDLSL